MYGVLAVNVSTHRAQRVRSRLPEAGGAGWLRSGFRLGSVRLQPRLDPASERAQVQRPRNPVSLVSTPYEHKGRNRPYPKPFAERRLVVGVDLGDLELSGELLGQALNSRRHNATGSAPGGPEVDEDGNRCLLDHRLEVRGTGFDQPGERLSTLPTVGYAPGFGQDSVPLAAGRTHGYLWITHLLNILPCDPSIYSSGSGYVREEVVSGNFYRQIKSATSTEVRQGARRKRHADRHPAPADRAAAGEDRDRVWVRNPGLIWGRSQKGPSHRVA